ncbi:hypothetical protein Hokovirus_5_24 [Hokovirus HKV1]|uniref:Uncharacterized protein n=1 Tax=Hokovirus HKV1 TaxID=1977638 RepID=A0A1V0SHE8_9VIRU|nr:hypothetical protein Hokovirus_5_24 [Hokovirus HKV1]
MDPLFSDIKKNFISQYKENIPNSFASNNFNGKIFKPEDNNFESEWKNYHKNQATYRLLCQICNVARNKIKL